MCMYPSCFSVFLYMRSVMLMNVQGNVSLKKKSLLDFQMEDTLSYKTNS